MSALDMQFNGKPVPQRWFTRKEVEALLEQQRKPPAAVALLTKTYDGESIVDLPRDVSEACDGDFTPAFAAIPQDQYGFQKGQFKVTIEWAPESA